MISPTLPPEFPNKMVDGVVDSDDRVLAGVIPLTDGKQLDSSGAGFILKRINFNDSIYSDIPLFICESTDAHWDRNAKELPSVLFIPYLPGREFACCTLALHHLKMLKELHSDGQGRRPEVWFHIALHGANQSGKALKYWNDILQLTNYKKEIKIALELDPLEDFAVYRHHWLSEPIGCVILEASTKLFVTTGASVEFWNTTLPNLLRDISVLNCTQLVLRQKPGSDERLLNACINFTSSLSRRPAEVIKRRLHHTMQPLHYNLEDFEYAGFETDWKKYELYGEAMRKALLHLNGIRGNTPEPFVIAVVGCGRGPLVHQALRAGKDAGVGVKVYAVEKNPKQASHLTSLKETVWRDQPVNLHLGDVRTWTPPEPLDILVSEMLGNFGCDECAPEVLCYPEGFLRPDGIAIPSTCTNYLVPVSSTRLFMEEKSSRYSLHQKLIAFDPTNFEFMEFDGLKPIFHFDHGPREKVSLPECKSVKVEFLSRTCGALHGFVGYFRATLFGDVEFCTIDRERTKDLGSWNPVFFSLESPVWISRPDVSIKVRFHRQRGRNAVWYEWQLTEPGCHRVQNLNGRCQKFSLLIKDEGQQ